MSFPFCVLLSLQCPTTHAAGLNKILSLQVQQLTLTSDLLRALVPVLNDVAINKLSINLLFRRLSNFVHAQYCIRLAVFGKLLLLLCVKMHNAKLHSQKCQFKTFQVLNYFTYLGRERGKKLWDWQNPVVNSANTPCTMQHLLQ